jgi:hypothetical protein
MGEKRSKERKKNNKRKSFGKAGGVTTSGVHPPWVASVKTPL